MLDIPGCPYWNFNNTMTHLMTSLENYDTNENFAIFGKFVTIVYDYSMSIIRGCNYILR